MHLDDCYRFWLHFLIESGYNSDSFFHFFLSMNIFSNSLLKKLKIKIENCSSFVRLGFKLKLKMVKCKLRLNIEGGELMFQQVHQEDHWTAQCFWTPCTRLKEYLCKLKHLKILSRAEIGIERKKMESEGAIKIMNRRRNSSTSDKISWWISF